MAIIGGIPHFQTYPFTDSLRQSNSVDFPAMFYLAMIFPAIAAIASGSTPQLSHLSVFVKTWRSKGGHQAQKKHGFIAENGASKLCFPKKFKLRIRNQVYYLDGPWD